MTKEIEKLEPFLAEKREEFCWALDIQGYNYAQIGRLFKINRSSVMRIIDARPKEYKPKWVKREA